VAVLVESRAGTAPANPSAPAAATAPTDPLEAARAFGVTFGPSVLLNLGVAASLIAAARGGLTRPRTRLARLLRPIVALGAAWPLLYALALHPWMARWGATDAEADERLPGDELVPEPGCASTRAVTVEAPAEAVWPWLAQIGQDRGGFYSHDWLENLAGCRMANADRVHMEWQRREIGEGVPLHPRLALPVTHFEPGRAIVLKGWGAFVVAPLTYRSCRVIVRGRVPRGLPAVFYLLLVEIPHFVMERAMLIGVKARAERAWERGG
jgi:hypothetical protein